MEISAQPYIKAYNFPTMSFAFLIRTSLMILALAAPFFIVYSTPSIPIDSFISIDFYLNSHLAVNETSVINYNSQYHLTIATDTQLYTYTNLFTQGIVTRPLTVQQNINNGQLTLTVEWPKSITEKVKNVKILMAFTFSSTGNYGVIQGEIKGYDLAEGSMMGMVTIEQGSGPYQTTSNIFSTNSNDLLSIMRSSYQSSSYLNYLYNAIPIDMPNDQLVVTAGINFSAFQIAHEVPTILGQLIWSFVQFFPIFLVFYWAIDQLLKFLFKQNILQRRVIHDQDYLRIVQQNKATLGRTRRI